LLNNKIKIYFIPHSHSRSRTRMQSHAMKLCRHRHLSHLHKTIESGWMESFTCGTALCICTSARIHLSKQ